MPETLILSLTPAKRLPSMGFKPAEFEIVENCVNYWSNKLTPHEKVLQTQLRAKLLADALQASSEVALMETVRLKIACPPSSRFRLLRKSHQWKRILVSIETFGIINFRLLRKSHQWKHYRLKAQLTLAKLLLQASSEVALVETFCNAGSGYENYTTFRLLRKSHQWKRAASVPNSFT